MIDILSKFDPITLEQMSSVKLMNRTDTKFVTNLDKLRQLLEMHARHTDSRRAMEILADFDLWLPRFKAVISDEYLDYLKGAKQHG